MRQMHTRLASVACAGAMLLGSGCGFRSVVTADADLEPDGGALDVGKGACGFGPPCDPDDFGGQSCASLGHGPGQLACTDLCQLDTSGCAPLDAGPPLLTGQPGTPGLPVPPTPPGAAPPLFGGLGATDGGAPLFGGAFGAGAGASDGGGIFGGGTFGGGNNTPQDAGPPDPDNDGGADTPSGGGNNNGGFFGGGNNNGGFFGGGNNNGGGFFGGGNNNGGGAFGGGIFGGGN